ncbi:MAG: hypothetical protein ABI912_05515 [Actinomycetota bacterium]
MRIEVQTSELRSAAARVAADAALLESLLVVARLDSAAASMPGTELAAAAHLAADGLRAALALVRRQMAACGGQLDAAAVAYELTDSGAVTRSQ